MKLKNIIAVIVVCIFMTGCVTFLQSLMTKVTPEQAAVITAMADEVKFKKPKKLKKSKKSKKPLKAGQWVTTLSKNIAGDMDVVLTTTKVISVRGKTVILETERYSAAQNGVREIAQMTIENYPVSGGLSYTDAEYNKMIKNMKITRVINKKGDEPAQEMPADILAITQGMAKGIAGNAVRTEEMKSGACETPYLKSARCYSFDFSAATLGITLNGTVTSNSYVPVSGMVKTESNQCIEETIAFGNRGAKSAL